MFRFRNWPGEVAARFSLQLHLPEFESSGLWIDVDYINLFDAPIPLQRASCPRIVIVFPLSKFRNCSLVRHYCLSLRVDSSIMICSFRMVRR